MYTKITHATMYELKALQLLLFETQCDEPIAAILDGETERSALCDIRYSDCEHASFPYRQVELGGTTYNVFSLDNIAKAIAEEERRQMSLERGVGLN